MLVIRSPKELQAHERELEELNRWLGKLKEKYHNDAEGYRMVAAGLEAMRRDIAEAVEDFHQALEGRLPPVLHTRDPQSGKLLIWRTLVLLRLAAQLDQSALARLLETQQSTVSRWESEGYDKYNLRQLQRIADSLGYDVDVAFVRRASPAPPVSAGGKTRRARARKSRARQGQV